LQKEKGLPGDPTPKGGGLGHNRAIKGREALKQTPIQKRELGPRKNPKIWPGKTGGEPSQTKKKLGGGLNPRGDKTKKGGFKKGENGRGKGGKKKKH